MQYMMRYVPNATGFRGRVPDGGLVALETYFKRFGHWKINVLRHKNNANFYGVHVYLAIALFLFKQQMSIFTSFNAECSLLNMYTSNQAALTLAATPHICDSYGVSSLYLNMMEGVIIEGVYFSEFFRQQFVSINLLYTVVTA